jgi:hypothetical protein
MAREVAGSEHLHAEGGSRYALTRERDEAKAQASGSPPSDSKPDEATLVPSPTGIW